MAKKKLLKFEEAETSPKKWKEFLAQSPKREKAEKSKITKSLNKSKKIGS